MIDKKSNKKMGKGATLIADNTLVKGDIQFDDQLFVNGAIEGNVYADAESNATLVLSDIGSVTGDIRVPYVVLNGTVNGDVHAGVRVELASKAQVTGNVYYKLIEMQLGAKVDGQLVYAEKDSEAGNVHQLPSSAAGGADNSNVDRD